jgi:aldehyde dehydrogenase (NAD+)
MISLGGQADTDRAVAAARRAFPGWAARPASERAAWLERLQAR